MNALVNFDGQIVDSNSALLVSNRAFNYGDGLFETMRFMNKQVQFVDKHYQRLIKGMELLGIEVPTFFSKDYIDEQVGVLVQQLGMQGPVRARISVFRKDGGFYSPTNNEASFIITCSSIAEVRYELNAGGYKLGLYDEILIPVKCESNMVIN